MKRNKHNLSNYKLATMDMGKLYPVQCIDVLPGDTMRLETSALIRMSPMVAPVMHPMTVRYHHWFVPYRILWDGWEDFITGGPDNQNADTVPTVTNNATAKNVLDYMGIPPVATDVNALPLRAYNRIYNEFYRDQDLQPTEIAEDNQDILHVAWRKDYFTTARPWAQKGGDLTLPIGTSAPVKSASPVGSGLGLQILDDDDIHAVDTDTGFARISAEFASNGMYADLQEATGITAIDFREFFALQRYAENRALYGSRYSEYLRFLGIRPSDARLQRPEYIGGGKSNLQISEVLQTAQDDIGQEQTPVGTMRGHGITALKTRGTRRFFEEHGVVLTLASIVPKSIYQDGINRMFLKGETKEEYFQKELQSIGQQEVWTGEVYTDGVNDKEIFGYSDRYAEYKTTPSTVSGEFRDTLDYWHLARKFSAQPGLNEDFIKCNPSKRIFAEQTQDSLWCMINNKVVARRMVKKSNSARLM